MNVKQEVYADGLGEIRYTGNMARLVFVSMRPGPDGKESGLAECFGVTMAPKGVISAYTAMKTLIDRLVDNGVLLSTEVKSEKKKPLRPLRKKVLAKKKQK